MARKTGVTAPQIALRKNSQQLVRVPGDVSASLRWWVEQYFRFEVTTVASSQKVQRRDLELFCDYVEREEGKDSIAAWSPRTSRAFQESLTREIDGEGGRLRKRKIKHAKA